MFLCRDSFKNSQKRQETISIPHWYIPVYTYRYGLSKNEQSIASIFTCNATCPRNETDTILYSRCFVFIQLKTSDNHGWRFTMSYLSLQSTKDGKTEETHGSHTSGIETCLWILPVHLSRIVQS